MHRRVLTDAMDPSIARYQTFGRNRQEFPFAIRHMTASTVSGSSSLTNCTGPEGCCTMTDLLMTFGPLGALGLITAIGYSVYQRELNRRCGWCFGSGREWC